MFDQSKLNDVLAHYKRDFTRFIWKNEQYKWKAIKWFQDHWKTDAEDFHSMLKISLNQTANLLASNNFYPREVIIRLAKSAPEEVRGMFIALFDESRDVYDRIKDFKQNAIRLYGQYGEVGKNHCQDERAITTYLWLKYPDKYYIYKFSEVQKVAEELKADFQFRKGEYAENIRNCFSLYNEISNALSSASELVGLFHSQLNDMCYSDPRLKTLTIDVGFYISRFYADKHYLKQLEEEPEQDEKNESPTIQVTPSIPDKTIDPYTKDNFLSEVYMTEERYDALSGVLLNKQNIILQGAPGVGKTFAARRLAWSIMGEKDDSRIEFVQFHQNYSYEDFMMGYKPAGDSFELKYGIFYRFCQKAANQPDKPFFFIIDEINRGNMSKIFGELLMLIEKDYRGTKATLAYNGMPFCVPKNLYIIGMMNTADRSLAMIDYALRRRFSFFDIEPGFDSQGFLAYQNSLNNDTLNALIAKVKDLNNEIALDKSLGKGFCIGHSYFCGRTNCTEEWLRAVVDYDILPMLREYWFDETNKLQRWENILQGVFQS